jgi:hypothetical protein
LQIALLTKAQMLREEVHCVLICNMHSHLVHQ